MKNINELTKQLKYHNDLYWNKSQPEISDTDYDILIEKLRKLDPENSLLNEFTEEISGTSVPHRVPMLSMGKAYDITTIIKWANSINCDNFLISPKMDGAACEIEYNAKGELVRASTRGNGMIGEDVTQAVKLIDNVPQKLSNPIGIPIEVRGEVVMHNDEFEKWKDQYSNPRNLASGTIKKKNPNKKNKKNILFYAYNVLASEIKTETEKFNFIGKNGFTHVQTRTVTKNKISETLEEFTKQRDNLKYGIDGLIVMTDDVDVQEKMGCTSHHPRYAIALKYQGESGTTTLNEIEWSVSRTSVLTPVALVKPIKLSGAIISRVSLHHFGFVESKKLTKGCSVLVTRRGEVIPHLEKKVKDNGGSLFEIPKQCPACGSLTIRKDDFLFCSDPDNCSATGTGRIKHFLRVLDIDGFGSTIIQVLYNSGLITSPEHLFMANENEFIECFNNFKKDNQNRMGEKTAKKLVKGINDKRSLTLDVFLRSLGVTELGNHVSKILADKYESLDQILQLSEKDLLAIDTIGPSIAKEVIYGLQDHLDLIVNLLQHVNIEKNTEQISGSFSGKSFVFTGKLTRMGRKEAQVKVKEFGGETPSSVSKTLTYLVYGEGRESSKQKKANQYNEAGAGIKIISEDNFANMI